MAGRIDIIKLTRWIGTLTVLGLCAAAPAGAQTVDYGTLEQIFGQPVTTSATGSPKLASDVPASMEIITADQIRRSGAHDIPTILGRLAGIDIWRWTNGATDVSVRGYNQVYNPRLLVLVNGRQVYLDHYGMTLWNGIPVELGEIRQIEVVKGPNTALFGFNALAGVVNIITFNPLLDDVSNATVRAGTQNHREASVVQTVKLSDRAGVRLSLGGFNADAFEADLPEVEQRRIVRPERRSMSLDGLFQVTPDSQLGVELTRVTGRETDFNHTYMPLADEFETKAVKVSYTAETDIGYLEATVYRNWYEALAYAAQFHATPYKNPVTVARLQDLFKIGVDHSVRLTGEYRHSVQNEAPLGGIGISSDVYALGGMWDWAITDRLSFTNAVRFDHRILDRDGPAHLSVPFATEPFTDDDFDRSTTEYSFNSGLVYKPTDLDTLRVSAGRGIQTPALLSLSYTDALDINGFMAAVISGNPDLQPVVAMNYEIGWDHKFPALDTTLRTSLYHQTTDGIIAQPEAGGRTFFRPPNMVDLLFENLGRSQLNGVELSAEGRIGESWRWGLNYTYEAIKDNLMVNREGTLVYPIDFEGSTPRHRINGHLGYTTGPLAIDLYGGLISGYKVPRGGTALSDDYSVADVPPRFILDGRLAYQLTDTFSVALEGLSINQTDYRATSGPDVERQLFLTLQGNF